tara:strand:+ start:5203 stop:5406 length:204 start_codon:yes stop_codon:yes gene_type:complete
MIDWARLVNNIIVSGVQTKEIAKVIGVSAAHVSNIGAGKVTKGPYFPTAVALIKLHKKHCPEQRIAA